MFEPGSLISRPILVCCDCQTTLATNAVDGIVVLNRIKAFAQLFSDIGLTVTCFEQNPEKLGPSALRGIAPHRSKTSFAFEPGLVAGFDTVLLAGFETHICIRASVMRLLEIYREIKVIVLVDLVSGRDTPGQMFRNSALQEMQGCDRVKLMSSESYLYGEVLADSNHSAFKAVLKFVKENPPTSFRNL